MAPNELEALIVGGGPAGLTAAIYLARYRRRFLVLDAGAQRCAWIPRSHNLPGFPDGAVGVEILQRMRTQAERYGAALHRTAVDRLEKEGENFRVQDKEGGVWRAPFVILATGVIDAEPDLPNLFDAVRRGLIRHCPICDGYEASDQRIGVIGHGADAVEEARFLRHYSADVTFLTLGHPMNMGPEVRRSLEAEGIRVEERPVRAVRVEGERIGALTIEGGEELTFDTLYSALGTAPRNDLARQAGAELAADGRVKVGDHCETTVPNLFAAGDIVPGLNQITVAEAQATIAATEIHNRLRKKGKGG